MGRQLRQQLAKGNEARDERASQAAARGASKWTWSQISAGGRQTLVTVWVGARRASRRGFNADFGSTAPRGFAISKQAPADSHCAPALHVLPVFSAVSASLQQSCCAAAVASSASSCPGWCIGQGGS